MVFFALVRGIVVGSETKLFFSMAVCIWASSCGLSDGIWLKFTLKFFIDRIVEFRFSSKVKKL
jgi:hypothetical protein